MVFPLKITHNTFDVLSPLICFKYSITYSIQLVLGKKKENTILPRLVPVLVLLLVLLLHEKQNHYNLEKPCWRRHNTAIDMATKHQGQQVMLVSVNHRCKLLYHIDNIYDHVKLVVKSGKASAATEIITFAE